MMYWVSNQRWQHLGLRYWMFHPGMIFYKDKKGLSPPKSFFFWPCPVQFRSMVYIYIYVCVCLCVTIWLMLSIISVGGKWQDKISMEGSPQCSFQSIIVYPHWNIERHGSRAIDQFVSSASNHLGVGVCSESTWGQCACQWMPCRRRVKNTTAHWCLQVYNLHELDVDQEYIYIYVVVSIILVACPAISQAIPLTGCLF